jgi:MYXO-CTERM domain-containing protein
VRRLAILSSSLFALCLGATANAAPSSFVVDVPSDARVSSAQPVASAKCVLRRAAAIPSHVRLELKQQRVIGGLRVTRFAQYHQGVLVYARGASIAVDVNGVSRLASSKIEERLPDSVIPSISRIDAAKVASKATGLNAAENNTKLLIWPTRAGGRLAYSVVPPSLLPIPYAPVVIVDAENGQVLTVRNMVQYKNLANVNEFNPVSSPTPIEVTLPIDDPHTTPQNELLVSYNCVDTHAVKTVNYMGFNAPVHVCEMQQNAEADATTGDYTQYEIEDQTAGGDPYAEISIFYHVSKAYEFFKGFEPTFELESTSKPLFLISNLMLPAGISTFDLTSMADPDLPLEPFDNAFSLGWEPALGEAVSLLWPEITGGGLAFGQGAKVDWAYDGDVVYHEFTHAVVGATLGLVGWWHVDEQGASASPAAMNEALADYFSSVITGDPVMGEYVGQADEETELRRLDNSNTCPSHLAGEEHFDSEFFSAALWAARSSLASEPDKFAFDRAIFTALNTAASGDLAFEELADLLVAGVGASSLGQTAADSLESEFSSRGVLPSCERTLRFEGDNIYSKFVDFGESFIAPGKNLFAAGSTLDFAPSTFQIEVPIPTGAAVIDASFKKLPLSGGFSLPTLGDTPFDPAYIVSFDAPISFDWSAKTNNASEPVAAEVSGSRLQASFDVPDGAQTAYFMLVNRGDDNGYVTSFSFDFEGPVMPDAGPDAAPEDAGVVDAATEDAGTQPSGPGASSDSDDGGCGCRTAGTSSQRGLGLAAMLAMLGFGVARRRRNGKSVRD